MTPTRRATLAPTGRTPILRPRTTPRRKVSVAAALVRPMTPGGRSRLRLHYETYPEAHLDACLYAEFVREQVVRRVRGPVVLLHDGGPIHRGEWFEELLDDFPRLAAEPLPAYAPELNPVEPVWHHLKGERLADFVPAEVDELEETLHREFHAIAKADRLLRGLWGASELPW